MERFPKEFRYGDLRKGKGKSQRDLIIKMREKARQEESVHWEAPQANDPVLEKPQRPGGFPKPTPYPILYLFALRALGGKRRCASS